MLSKKSKLIGLSVALAVLSGCAHVKPTDPVPNPDPFEPVNRPIFYFNKYTDKYIFKPIAEGYKFIMPDVVRNRITNVFANVDEIPSTVNHALQGDFDKSAENLARFLMNSTFGLGGMFDVATDMNLPKNQTTLGETMVVWGGNYSPYVVLPLLGPSTVRDATGRVVDNFMKPYPYIQSDEWKYGILALRVIDLRATYLDKDDVVDTVSFDDYVFMRDAYLQRANRKGSKLPSNEEHTDPDDFESY